MNNFWPEYYKYLNNFVKSAAPYRDNTVPAGSVIQSNIDKELDRLNKPVQDRWDREKQYITAATKQFNNDVANIDNDLPQYIKDRKIQELQSDLNSSREFYGREKQRFNRNRRQNRKKVYQEMQPRPGQPLRDYQKAQAENYNNAVNSSIEKLQALKDRSDAAKNGDRVEAMLLPVRFNQFYREPSYYQSRFRDTNRAYRAAENERQLLLEQVPDNQKSFIANQKIRVLQPDNPEMRDIAGKHVTETNTIKLKDYGNGQIMPHVGIHEGIHALTNAQPNTPMNNAMVNQYNRKSMELVDVNDKRIPKAQLALKNELRSINGTERITDQNAELLPAKDREAYKASGTDDWYKKNLFQGAGLKHVPNVRSMGYTNGRKDKQYSRINKLTDKIVRGKEGINVGKILDIEPADKEWNNTYAQGFGKAYKENPEAIDWLMENKTNNYRLKPTATGKDRWNRASKKNKKSSILDNIEIALEKDNDKADLLDWYKKNREDINYQYGVAKSVDRHERKAKRKKLDRKEWEARRKAKGKTAGYYPLWLQYIYS